MAAHTLAVHIFFDASGVNDNLPLFFLAIFFLYLRLVLNLFMAGEADVLIWRYFAKPLDVRQMLKAFNLFFILPLAGKGWV